MGLGNQGREIVPVIPADSLSNVAREGVVSGLLGTTSDTDTLEHTMAAASIRPDLESREPDILTAPWHFIWMRLQDRKSDVPARCLGTI